MKKSFFVTITIFLLTNNAWAASRFWVGGTGNWSDNTNHWSASSGGAAGASKPTTGDTATFDASSGGGTVTFDEAVATDSITMGAFTGTVDFNDQNVTLQTFSVTGTGTRTLDMGASAIAITGTGSAWNAATVTNLTVSANTAVVTLSGSSTNIFNGGSKDWNGLSLVFTMTSGNSQITNGGTIKDLTTTGTTAKTGVFNFSGSCTFTGAVDFNGNSATNRIRVGTSTLGTASTLTLSGASASLTGQNVDFRDITISSTGGAPSTPIDLSAITGLSGDCGGNSGITFTTAATQTWDGTTGNWSTSARWTSRVPLPQDDVNVAASSAGTLTADMPRLGKSIDFTGGGALTLNLNSLSTTNYGSFTLISGMTFTHTTNTHAFEGRGSFTLTSAGKTWASSSSAVVQVAMVGGTLTLQDAFIKGSGTGSLSVTHGTFDANDFNVTCAASQGFASTQSNSQVINMGNGTWTISGASGTPWNVGVGATVNAEGSTILISDTGASSKTFAGGGKTYNNLQFSGGGAGAIIITGANTFNRIYTDGGGTKSITLPGSTTTTLISGTDLANGSNVITFTASAGSATVAQSSGQLHWNNVSLTNIIASGSAGHVATHSTDGGGNTGWLFQKNQPFIAFS